MQFLKQEFTDFDVFHQQGAVIFFSIPSGFPVADDADTHSNWTNFLTHESTSYRSSTTTVMWLVRFKI